MRVFVLAAVLLALAAPSFADPGVQQFVPKGYHLVGTVPGFGHDTVAVVHGETYPRVFVLHKGQPIWLVTKEGKRDFPAPVQGGAGENLGRLVYTATVQKHRLLFVTVYLADAYNLFAFEASGNGYKQVFQTHSMDTPKVDKKTGRITVEQMADGQDAAVPVSFVWHSGGYVKEAAHPHK